MFGFSIFLNEEIDLAYLNEMQQAGFSGIFTSIHIPEDNVAEYIQRLKVVGEFTRQHEMEFVVDISEAALKNIGLDFETISQIHQKFGLTGIRADYGINNQMIAQMSRYVDVKLNASTISTEDFKELVQYKADFTRLEAWHNYYPRPETGLDELLFQRLNSWLEEQGLKVMAFVPGDSSLRGPLYQGLPTLEQHRNQSPFATALDLKYNFGIEKIFIGDPQISETSLKQFSSFIQEQTLIFRATPLVTNEEREQLHLTDNRVWTSRMDVARDIIRDTNSRLLNASLTIEPQKENLTRPSGSITVDNDLYLRYKGSIHISRHDLPADEKVNLIGQVILEDLNLLELIQPGQAYQIQWQSQ